MDHGIIPNSLCILLPTFFFFLNDPPTPEISPLPLPAALPFLLTGALPAADASAQLAGQPMLGRKTFEVCRMGVGRTFQVVRSFPRLPVLDNVIVGAYGAGLSDRDAIASAVRALHQVGLQAQSGVAGR